MLSCNLKNVRREALNIQSSVLSATLAQAKTEFIVTVLLFLQCVHLRVELSFHLAPQCFYSRSKLASADATLGFSNILKNSLLRLTRFFRLDFENMQP